MEDTPFIIAFNVTFHLCLGLPSGFFPSASSCRPACVFLGFCACYLPYPTHLPLFENGDGDDDDDDDDNDDHIQRSAKELKEDASVLCLL